MAPPAVQHLLPTDDVIGHEASEACVCRPYRRPIDRTTGDDGYRRFAVVHPRLDGCPAEGEMEATT